MSTDTIAPAPVMRAPTTNPAPLSPFHLAFPVDDLDAAEAHTVAAGAVLAEYQPQDHVRVYLDPAGHPFCLFMRD